jgi:hypothetical protein
LAQHPNELPGLRIGLFIFRIIGKRRLPCLDGPLVSFFDVKKKEAFASVVSVFLPNDHAFFSLFRSRFHDNLETCYLLDSFCGPSCRSLTATRAVVVDCALNSCVICLKQWSFQIDMYFLNLALSYPILQTISIDQIAEAMRHLLVKSIHVI